MTKLLLNCYKGTYFNYVDGGATADGSLEAEPHLKERILQLQKKELDKSLGIFTEDDGY